MKINIDNLKDKTIGDLQKDFIVAQGFICDYTALTKQIDKEIELDERKLEEENYKDLMKDIGVNVYGED